MQVWRGESQIKPREVSSAKHRFSSGTIVVRIEEINSCKEFRALAGTLSVNHYSLGTKINVPDGGGDGTWEEF